MAEGIQFMPSSFNQYRIDTSPFDKRRGSQISTVKSSDLYVSSIGTNIAFLRQSVLDN